MIEWLNFDLRTAQPGTDRPLRQSYWWPSPKYWYQA